MTWTSRRVGFFGSLIALLASAAPAPAQPKTVLPPAKDGRLENLVPVPAPDARAVALSEPLGLLAFGHGRQNADGQVSLVRLDAKGNPAAYATTWKVPPTPGLEKFDDYALSVAFHPKLPLLYVWHDVSVPFNTAQPAEPPTLKNFDHLLIYDVSKDAPELVVSLCRGRGFGFGMSAGALAVDPTGAFLYVPNIVEIKTGFLRLGRFPLGADGLPEVGDKDAKGPRAVRAKRLTDLNPGGTVYPPQVTPIEYVNLLPGSNFGAGHCFCPLGRDVVLAGGNRDVLSWRPDDKTATLHGLPVKCKGLMLFNVHPTLPVLFATTYASDAVFRVEQVEGYLTLLPREIVFPDTELSGAPAVLTKSNKLAVGGHYHVYVAGLDDKGQVLPDVLRVRVLNKQVQALVYSERFDRLYVGVELSK